MLNHKKNIYYLGFFSNESLKKENRSSFRASHIPMLYITDAIKRAGYAITRVSASRTQGTQSCPAHVIEIDDQEKDIFFKSFGNKGKSLLGLNILQSKYELFKFFFKNVKKNDTVIVYHSLFYLKIILFLRKIIKFRLVLEVAEIYSDVHGTPKMSKKERKNCSKADAYLFFSELIEEEVNINKKPYAISYGTYFCEPIYGKSVFGNDKSCNIKHLVYAGTFSQKKGGASIAASVAKHLSTDYHIHIIGSGTDKEQRDLQKLVDEISGVDCAKVTIDGCFSGDEYIKFLQSCDVGLSTQNSAETFNNSSFPSKVTSYLSNGLRVVAGRIPALERSELSSLLYYYDGNNPEAIAEAIKSIDWSQKYDSRQVILDLDKKFVRDIEKLLSNE